jgi:hypothetical protein
MNKLIPFTIAILAALFIAACQEEPVMAPVQTSGSMDAAAALAMIDAEISAFDAGADEASSNGNHGNKWGNRNFIGILSGRNEVPERETHGRGVAKFKVSKDGGSIHYKLIVANISNVVGAHVHQGPAGVNGPVAVALYSAPPGGGKINGPIAEGSFTPADLVGPYAGSTDFNLFLSDLHADSLYVNVHTNDGIDPANTGAGDFPGGEIRGQLKGHAMKGKDNMGEGKKAGHGGGNGNNGHGNGNGGN